MFDRFTDRARRVMGLARQEAQRLNHEYLNAEHVYLGLVAEGNGVAANVLRNLEAKPLEPNRNPDKVLMGQLPFTPNAKKVLEQAVYAASRLGHNYVGTEHLLLGICEVKETQHIIEKVGLTPQAVLVEVCELLGAVIKPAPSPVEDDGVPDEVLPPYMREAVAQRNELIIRHIKEKIHAIMLRPAMYVGYDANALASLMLGYLDALDMALWGHTRQSHGFMRGEWPKADTHKTWEQNVAEIKRVIETHLEAAE